jgi:hypothetical protein
MTKREKKEEIVRIRQKYEKGIQRGREGSVADLHRIDADPDPAFHFDADPDPTFHYDSDPDPDSNCQIDAYQDPAFHSDEYPDPGLDPTF